ncbi:hypothetical protein BASA82_000614 [Batrachochytrium salamandrivorans]|nr:hypothetical protein BASA81_003888 [Batrachochytrium salamandrivorans]KAH9262346.1 hypothetical protein BASA82_000614 [Batrachochytrium salamandrivorans]
MEVVTLVFGSQDALVSGNWMFARRQKGGDLLFDSSSGVARAIVVAPNLIPQTVTPLSSEAQAQREREAANEAWGENVQRVRRDFAMPKTLAEPWFHKSNSYFESTAEGGGEGFANSMQYFLESVDRFGGVQVLGEDVHLGEMARAMELVADETCGSEKLKAKSVGYIWGGLPQAVGALGPLLGTFVPLDGSWSAEIHTMSLPYRTGKKSLAEHLFPVSSFPSPVSVSHFVSTAPDTTNDGEWGRVEAVDPTTKHMAVLAVDKWSANWLGEKTALLATREAKDYSTRRLHLESDEHAEMLTQMQAWGEDYEANL